MKVAIIGVTGYSGLELVRLINIHPALELISVHSQSQINNKLDDIYPHLRGICSLTLEDINPTKIMATTELVFFAAPAGVSSKLAAPFIAANFPVIDLAGDFRLRDLGTYQKWYGKKGPQAADLAKGIYGLPEFQVAYSRRLIANPGCYATGTLLSLAPLVIDDFIEPTSIIVDGKSGLSGAGKNPTTSSHFATTNENMTVYKLNEHQHIPEIIQQLSAWNPVIQSLQFTTSLIPVTRGILLTIYLRPRACYLQGLTSDKLIEKYRLFYQDKPFVRVQPLGKFPDLKQVIGSNYCDIGLSYNPVTQLITLVTTLDNLVKGAAGQAIQNANILASFPETSGLVTSPLYP